ncbi:bidirectional sugar transporter SWEET6b-like [Triticum urartu]|uniref:bidirectional sugar transporter SWEET6b-like n=1 Tax=Triticum urartu TaxID=4572 RepID=UPI00204388A8|nr:bidirectional sugar transporter SWEET6b-like [Triticum urartu]
MVAPAPAPASSLEVDGTQLVLGYFGVATALLLIGSPIPTFWTILNSKNVGAEEPYSYMAVLFNAAAYVTYGIPVFADKTNKPVMLANTIGIVFELAYVIIFIVHVAANRRRNPLIALVVAFLGLLLGTVVFGHVWSRTYMGWVAMFSGIAMY